MKRKLIVLFALIVGAFAYAEVSSSKLFVGVYDFATEASDLWKIYDAEFETVSPVEDFYSFTGGFVVKMLGYTRYNFTCEIEKQNDDFSVKLLNVTSVVCDKNGVKKSTSNTAKTPENVSVQYAAQMKDEIKKRIEKKSDAEAKDFLVSYLVDAKNNYNLGKRAGDFVNFLESNDLLIDEVITDTAILKKIAKNSAAGEFASFLYDYNLVENESIVNDTGIIAAVAKNSSNDLQFERYLTKTGLIGKQITLPIVYKSVDKNRMQMGGTTAYLVTAESASSIIFYATNNEDFIDYKTNKKMEITGTIKSIRHDGLTGVITLIMCE